MAELIRQKYNIAVISNDLVPLKWGLDLPEYRVVTALLDSIYKLDLDNLEEPIDIDLQIYARDYGISVRTAYRDFKQVLSTIMTKQLAITIGDISIDRQYIREIWYRDSDEPILRVLWESRFINHIIPNRSLGNYTRLCTLQRKFFTTIQAATLYRLIKQHAFKRTVVFSIDYLREHLDIPENKYLVYGNFNNRVLRPAIQDINKLTDIIVSYKKDGTSKRVLALKFTIFAKVYSEKFKT